VSYQFQRAVKTIAALTPAQHRQLESLCLEIRSAESQLRHGASPLLTRCHTICRGLCCRNIQLNALVHHGDFVFLLTLARGLQKRIAECLQQEDPLFPKDCIFLADGSGPCIFPEDIRPQICVTAFCTDTTPVRAEIARVKRKFFKLDCYLAGWRLANGLRRILRFPAPGHGAAP